MDENKSYQNKQTGNKEEHDDKNNEAKHGKMVDNL